MRVFEQENRMTSDECAFQSKESQNKFISEYVLFNVHNTSTDCQNKKEKLTEFMINNPNLNMRDGFGNANSCTVDQDSSIRNDPTKITNFKDRNQLCTRWHQGVPNYTHAGLVPNVESSLKFGNDTSYIRNCDRVTEKGFDVFVPFNTCGLLNPDVIPPFESGVSTRDFVRNDDYAKRCGLMPRQVVSSSLEGAK
jgi:hypothetical protein